MDENEGHDREFRESEKDLRTKLEDFDDIKIFDRSPRIAKRFTEGNEKDYFLYDLDKSEFVDERPVLRFRIRRGSDFPGLRNMFPEYKGRFEDAFLVFIRYDAGEE